MTRVIEWDGLDRLQRLLIQGGRVAAEASEEVVYEEAHIAFGDSQVEVPVRDGVLRSSGRVSRPRLDGGVIEVEITYGGAASEYAEIVHENLTANHASPTKAKFLEDPVNRRAATFGQSVASRVERKLRGIR